MEYSQLSQEYRDDVLAEAMYARELEWFHYDFDAGNFAYMLQSLPKGEHCTQIEGRLSDTQKQLERVSAIYIALKARVLDPVAHAKAVARTTVKRELASKR